MAQTVNFLVNCLFVILQIYHLPCFYSKSSGFSLKLVHRDSPLSPLYQPNLSDFQRFQKNVEISKSRALYFQHWSEAEIENLKNSQNNIIRLPLKYYDPIFTVELGLGTPVVKRTFLFDTGSHFTWTECQPCVKCFKQDQPLFDIKKSSSYRQMPKNHKLATKEFNCTASGCSYCVGYHSGQYSSGISSLENFTFQTSKMIPYRVSGLVFGCGTANKGPFGATTAITGILGMDKDPLSFVHQLGGQIKARFSYCLPTIKKGNPKQSYLRFGDEAIIRKTKYQSLPFLNLPRNTKYILNLIDISIGGQRVGLERGAFPKGCIIDSGSSLSQIQGNAFSSVEESIKKYFAKFKNLKIIQGRPDLNGFLCYSYTGRFKSFPTMKFHFQGANLDVPPENLFIVANSRFCLEIIASKDVTILGAYQQQNTRFVYDLNKNMLSFAKEDCSKDADIFQK